MLPHLTAVGKACTAEYHDPPLSDAEVAKTAASVAQYVAQRRCLVRGMGGAFADDVVLDQLERHPLALAIYLRLHREHFDRREFHVMKEWIKARWGVGDHQATQAVRQLVLLGFLNIVKRGGRGPGDATIYAFGRPLRV